jgi:hypothetical protein
MSAPESLVLLWGAETGDAWAVKMALMELVVRRALILSRVERRRFLRSPQLVHLLALGIRRDQISAQPLRVVLDMHSLSYTSNATENGVPVDRLATRLFTHHFRAVRSSFWRRRWDRSAGGFVTAEILPSLEQQGIFAREESVRLGLFPSKRWALTPQGIAKREELQRFTSFGHRHFGRCVKEDPMRAASYIERVGPALLLLGGIAPLVQQLYHGQATSTEYSWGTDLANPNWDGDPFTTPMLAGSFGPSPGDDMDTAFHVLSVDVDRAWEDLHRRGGFVFGGE